MEKQNEITRIAEIITKILKAKTYYTGEFARSLLMQQKTPKNIDIIALTSIDDVYKKIEARQEFFTLKTYKQKNTCTVVYATNSITYFRIIACKGNNIKEYLKNYLFSINALLVNSENSEIIDYYNGLEDIKNKKIRAIFLEELGKNEAKILEAIHLASQLGFDIEEKTFLFIKQQAKQLKQSKEAKQKFLDILKTKYLASAIKLMFESEITQNILPTTKKDWQGKEQELCEKIKIIEEEAREAIEIVLAILLIKRKPKAAFNIIQEHFRNSFNLGYLVKELVMLTKALTKENLSLSEKRILLNHKLIKKALIIIKAAAPKKHKELQEILIKYKDNLLPKPIITGHDLIKLGLKPRPVFKDILQKIYQAQLNEKFNTKEDAVNWIIEKGGIAQWTQKKN